ncbi:alpha/beta fold hydrolase [Acidovorax sp. SDU_ACID1]|uniref:alpha/beta fold hydrolase n=1 Tax=Acidovorax sp. SDU_ACID1 TaxID=3136632 RepID=UPI003872B149
MHWSETLHAKARAMDARFPQRAITLPDGATLSFRERPAHATPALTVVLLHGISSSAASWYDVALALPPGLRVLAWDAPGYGASTPLATPTPVNTDYADRLRAWIAQEAAGRVALVGHSLGALMAAPCAAQAAGLLLISPAGGYAGSDKREQVRAERLAALDTLGVHGLAQRIDQRLLSPAADEQAREWVRWSTARLHAGGYRQAVHMLCDSDLGRHAPAPVPVTVAVGEHDVVTPPAACERWARAYQAPFTLLPGAGHASPTEQPGAVASWIVHHTASLP